MSETASYLVVAARHERNDEPVLAAAAYESAILTGQALRNTYVNLAVLYFVCNDGGYAAAHKLDRDFLQTAWERIDLLLDEAAVQFGNDSEIEFWQLYSKFVLLGQEHWIDPARCIELLHAGDSMVPSFYLVGSFAGITLEESKRYVPMAKTLLDEVREGRTVRERYIRSVLASALRKIRIQDGAHSV